MKTKGDFIRLSRRERRDLGVTERKIAAPVLAAVCSEAHLLTRLRQAEANEDCKSCSPDAIGMEVVEYVEATRKYYDATDRLARLAAMQPVIDQIVSESL